MFLLKFYSVHEPGELWYFVGESMNNDDDDDIMKTRGGVLDKIK